MTRIYTLCFALLIPLLSCNNGGKNNASQWNNNSGGEHCSDGQDNDGDGLVDCADSDCNGSPNCATNNDNNDNNDNNENNTTPTQMFTLRGKVWAPGADSTSTVQENMMPMSGALVAGFFSLPPEIPFCNECVEIPVGVPNTFSAADGSFELKLVPNRTYFLTVQKGSFRRVTEYTAGAPGETEDMEAAAGTTKDSRVTLPNHHDPANGYYMPRILVVKGTYNNMDDMSVLFGALGFTWQEALGQGNIDAVDDDGAEAEVIVNDLNRLKQYNLIIFTCGGGSSFLTSPDARANLRQYVHDGGKLYVDDFAYDWALQPFPEFLTLQGNSGDCGGGTTPPSSVGSCNIYSSYDPIGTPGDPNLEQWLNAINPSGTIQLMLAFDIIKELHPGVQGECNDDSDPNCQNGIYTAPPKVWMYGNWNSYTHHPVTVSWNYYCGKVLYTTYHTEGGEEGFLLLQEKIMFYLIMEMNTCSEQIIIE